MSELVSLLTLYVLPLLGPLLVVVGGFTLWRTRRREGRWSLAGSVVVVLGVAFTAFVFWLDPSVFAPVLGPVNRLVERVSGETPQAKVSSYLALVARGDRDGALVLWPANDRLGSDYKGRRHSVTTELEGLGPELSHRVLKIEWWSTCCEPHVITDNREAGFARLWVEVSRDNEARQYVFDLLAPPMPYLGRWEGYPVRHWQILDVYPVEGEPLVWRWPGY
ncbi:MAG TPA: hypothetical protein DCP08_05685 [Chloroflexi bacterium]|nr:hypothetical protein [Chloroflexota bacterium]